MDLESENSALESTGDNDPVCPVDLPIGDGVKIDSNGSHAHSDGFDLNSNGNGHLQSPLDPVNLREDADRWNSDEQETARLRPESASLHQSCSASGEYVGSFEAVNSFVAKGSANDRPVEGSPLSSPKELLGGHGMSPPVTAKKGKGLRKWRRIKRDPSKDHSSNPDVLKILKRDSANLDVDVEAGMKQKSEGSLSSTNAFVNNPVAAGSFSAVESSSVHKSVGVATFSVGAADSDNSEDRSSKSSTAASVPKSRHDPHRVSGHSRDKYRMKHMGAKHLGSSSQVLQHDPGEVDTSKKPRSGAINMDQENSLSSLESDSRSHSSVFMQGSSSAFNNELSERSVGYDGEHSYDGPADEQQSFERPPSGPSQTVRENEELSRGGAALSWQIRGESMGNQFSGKGDPLVDCVRMLHSAQEALEQEIQKFGELGKGFRPLDESIKATGLPIHPESLNVPTSEGATRDNPNSQEAKLASRAQINIKLLEKQLDEAMDILKEKESRIAELETTLNQMKSSTEDLGRSVEAQLKKYEEIEAEMDGLFEQKMEAEFKYIAISDMVVRAQKQVNFLQAEQESIATAQSQMLGKVEHLEYKAATLEENTDVSVSEIRKMKRMVDKFSLCFLIQLILFIFVAKFLLSQLLPESEVVMPT